MAAALLVLAFLLAGCGDSPEQQRSIGQAFVGPKKLSLHKEISPKSPVIATPAHGERLDILGRRRRFVRVRTQSGAVGWTHMGQLMAADDMTALDDLAEQARELPAHGKATVFESLNVHSAPNRQSPSFYQIHEGEQVDVVLHQTAPRVAYQASPIFSPAPKPEPKLKKKREPKYPPPPMPPAPRPPDNWLELSKTVLPEELRPQPKPVPIDDWSLVKLKNGRAGWVLTSQLRMSIPDEVAQYSEGQRITSYFPMMDIPDGGAVRHHWLWTTLSTTRQPYQFDGFRYFIWNVRRHRYETAYIERNVKGYFPIEVRKVSAQGTKGQMETFPGFTLIVEEPDGTRYKKTYAFQYYRVVLLDKRKYEPPQAPHAEEQRDNSNPQVAAQKKGWLVRIKKLFGR